MVLLAMKWYSGFTALTIIHKSIIYFRGLGTNVKSGHLVDNSSIFKT